MPKQEEFNLHPFGWEKDPDEERFKLCAFDYLSTITYTSSVIFFRLRDEEKSKAVAALKEGLERTLSQVRHLVGTIEKDQDGYHSIVRRKASTFQFVVQYLDGPEDVYPSLDEIADAHYLSPILGDINVLSNLPMTCGSKPEAHPDNSPIVASAKASFINGGLILNISTHHWTNGLNGFASFLEQLSENCFAATNGTEFPSFDPRCMDRTLFGPFGFDSISSSESQVDAPPRRARNLQHKHSQAILFHLPKSKTQALKKLASPTDGTWITTFNAICALLWRVSSRLREPLYKPGLDYKPLWAGGVSVTRFYTDPPMPKRIQGNLQMDITSEMSEVPQLTLAEIISDAPLSKLAMYTRQVTESVNLETITAVLKKVASVRNKQDLSINVDSFQPMSLLTSDWRKADVCALNFGFSKPTAHRHLFGGVPLSQVVVFPPRVGPAGDDEGIEVQVSIETEIIPKMINDPEWSRYFEFRGVDASEEGIPDNQKAKL
ncbi:acyl transferase [Fusarium heterosporum]|uniref:Acyl transferase n=1 Tax=Fusarium heterosporum TaxID=42747 RepID=A0A8H5WQJ8_FUSHE|nr:acyl transferase [Fusarium heterosporum]